MFIKLQTFHQLHNQFQFPVCCFLLVVLSFGLCVCGCIPSQPKQNIGMRRGFSVTWATVEKAI